MTEKVTWRGKTFDKRTADMLAEVASLTGPIYVRPTQGSYNTSVSASAGTHARGGAVDIIAETPEDMRDIVREMRRVGFAAWLRTPQQSDWPYHVHGIAVQPEGQWDMGVLSTGAHAQVIDYFNGRNGLASRGQDDGPRQFVGVTWETYQEAEDDVKQEDIDRIAQACAAAVNRVLGDYNAKGEPSGPNKADPQLGATYVRQIKRLVEKLG